MYQADGGNCFLRTFPHLPVLFAAGSLICLKDKIENEKEEKITDGKDPDIFSFLLRISG